MKRVGFFLNIILIFFTAIFSDNQIKADPPPVVLWHGMGKTKNMFTLLFYIPYYKATYKFILIFIDS